MRLRLLLPLLAAGAIAWQASPPAAASGSVTRPCGTLSIGIGWHLRSSQNVTCSSARVLITSYFKRRGNRQTVIVVSGYSCSKRDLATGEQIRCVQASKLVTAKSFGY